MSNRCGFRIDVRKRIRQFADQLCSRHPESFSDPQIDGFDDIPTTNGHWQCPRSAADGTRCVLHDESSTPGEVGAEIEAAIAGKRDDSICVDEIPAATAARRFYGLQTDILDVSRLELGGTSSVELDIRFGSVDELRATETTLDGGINAAGGEFGTLVFSKLETGRPVQLAHATVSDDVQAADCSVAGAFSCRFATIGGDVELSGATATGRFDFGFAEIAGRLVATKGACGGRLTLKEATVGSVVADRLVVSGPDAESDIPGFQFRGLTTEHGVSIVDCDCEGTLIGYDVTIGDTFDAARTSISDDVLFGEHEHTNLPEASFHGCVDFSDATIGGVFSMRARSQQATNPTVGGTLRLDGLTVEDLQLEAALTHERIDVVSCRGATIDTGVLKQPATESEPPVVYDLTEATVGDVMIDGGVHSVPDCVWFDRTIFEGFRFTGDERVDFAAANWELISPEDSRTDRIAYTRAFPDAASYVSDLRTLLVERPAVSEWLRTTDPPYDVTAVAECVFDGIDDATVERIATNGPERRDQLGSRVYERERYRCGIVTFLARELDTTATPATRLFYEAGDNVRTLAEAIATTRRMADDPTDNSGRINRTHDLRPTAVREAEASLRDHLAATAGEQSTVQPSLIDQELTYLEARKGTDDVGDSTTAGQFFIHEARVRRRRHLSRGRYARYGSNLLFDLVAGYGERPGRPFMASVLTVLVFAGIYRGLWVTVPETASPTYSGPFGELLLSVAAFTAFVLGDVDVAPLAIRTVAAIEAFLGAFLIALFVFTLTRSVRR